MRFGNALRFCPSGKKLEHRVSCYAQRFKMSQLGQPQRYCRGNPQRKPRLVGLFGISAKTSALLHNS